MIIANNSHATDTAGISEATVLFLSQLLFLFDKRNTWVENQSRRGCICWIGLPSVVSPPSCVSSPLGHSGVFGKAGYEPYSSIFRNIWGTSCPRASDSVRAKCWNCSRGSSLKMKRQCEVRGKNVRWRASSSLSRTISEACTQHCTLFTVRVLMVRMFRASGSGSTWRFVVRHQTVAVLPVQAEQ